MGRKRVVGDPTVVVGYTRVSTEEQVASGAGLDAQQVAIEQEVARRGWTLLHTYTDAGLSGRSMANRPELKAALMAVESGEAGTLVVAKLDRLSRSLLDFAGLMAEAKRRDYNIVALDLGIDLSTPAGEFLASVMASAAQWERRIISQRTRDAMAAKRGRGVRFGRPTTVPPERAAGIAAMRAEGRSLQSIADQLNEEGVPTGHAGAEGQAAGTKWHRSTVDKVVKAFDRGVYDNVSPDTGDNPASGRGRGARVPGRSVRPRSLGNRRGC